MLPKSVAYYKISPTNVGGDTSKITALVTDATNAADSDVNFNDYVIFALGATQKEYEMVGPCPIAGMLGFEITSITNKSGKIISNAAEFGRTPI